MPQSGAQIVFVLPPTFEKTLSISACVVSRE